MAKEETQNPQNGGWDDVANQLEASSGGKFAFPAKGVTRIRLVTPKGKVPQQFFQEFDNFYNGRKRSRFLCLAVVFHADGLELREGHDKRIVPFVLPKQAIQQIVNFAREGWEFFDMKKGHGVVIRKEGAGLNTSYSITQSKDEIAIPEDVEWPEQSIEELALEASANSLNRGTDNNADGPSDKTAEEPKSEPGKDW